MSVKGEKESRSTFEGVRKRWGPTSIRARKERLRDLRVCCLYVSELNSNIEQSRVISNLSRRSLRFSLVLASRLCVVYICLSLHLIWV